MPWFTITIKLSVKKFALFHFKDSIFKENFILNVYKHFHFTMTKCRLDIFHILQNQPDRNSLHINIILNHAPSRIFVHHYFKLIFSFV